MLRREVLAFSAFALLTFLRVAFAQNPPVVFFFSPRPRGDAEGLAKALRAGMRQQGYVEGKTYLLREVYGDGQYGSLPSLAADIVASKPNVVVAIGSPTIRAVREKSATIPIVIGSTGDAVESGLVQSLARPGNGITGVSNLTSDISTKHLELLIAFKPDLKRIAILGNSGSLTFASIQRRITEAATTVGMAVVALDAGTPAQLEMAFSKIDREKAEAVIAVADGFIISQISRIVEMTFTRSLPSIFQYREYAEAGGLISYGVNNSENLRRSAVFVDKILKGADAGELPIEQTTKFELVINLRTAKAFGLSVPASLLATADDVIE